MTMRSSLVSISNRWAQHRLAGIEAFSLASGCGLAAECPAEQWSTSTTAEAGLDGAKLMEARDYALIGYGSDYITRGGKLVLSWGDLAHRYDIKSSTKSFGAAALGLAIKDGKMRLDDLARQHHPPLRHAAGEEHEHRLAQ